MFSHFKSAKKDIDKIFVGEHLRPIVEALGVQDVVTFIDVGLDTPPKLFNYRKSSLLSVLKSFFLIRKTLNSSYYL